MADGRGVEDGRTGIGSVSSLTDGPSLARGAAGAGTGARPQAEDKQGGDIEERRESEQVLRPTSDGMGDGLVKDQG